MEITNKVEYFKLWNAGLLGNKLRSWNSLDDISREKYQGLVSLRVRRPDAGGAAKYNIKSNDAPSIFKQTLTEDPSLKAGEIYFNESAPDDLLITQGEIMRSNDVYDLMYCEEKLKMRDAMRKAKRMTGILVVAYLKELMTANSWDELQELFDRYPDSIIEFGIYQNCLGCYPGRNCLIWEVRNY